MHCKTNIIYLNTSHSGDCVCERVWSRVQYSVGVMKRAFSNELMISVCTGDP